jgi:hypothetical protein
VLFAELAHDAAQRPRSSRESILRETPTWSTVGMKTRNRPGMVT